METPISSYDTVIKRMAFLESRLRVYRFLIIFSIIVALTAGGMVTWLLLRPQLVAKEFLLQDEYGTKRASLRVDRMERTQDGRLVEVFHKSSLVFYDENGFPCAGLTVARDTPYFSLLNYKSGFGITIHANEDGIALGLGESKEKGAGIGISTNLKRSVITVNDSNGLSRIELTSDRAGSGIVIKNDKGETVYSKP